MKAPGTIDARVERAASAARSGRNAEAAAAWRDILDTDPNNAAALAGLGRATLLDGDVAASLDFFQKAAEAEPGAPSRWIDLALACRRSGDENAEDRALLRALEIDSHELYALILKGELSESLGRTHEAAKYFSAAASVSPSMDRLVPFLRPKVAHARAYCEAYGKSYSAFIDARIQDDIRSHGAKDTRRFLSAMDHVVGRRKRFDPSPTALYFPELPPIEFYDRELFPWLSGFEEATEEIRREVEAMLEDNPNSEPYINYDDHLPLNQFKPLNHSTRWSAIHLFKNGAPAPENIARAPVTASLLSTAPQPIQPGRTPAAMFSLLRPKTRIPPHVGVTNTRLVVHVPLIVPAGCGFRVGNTTRGWSPGEAFVFDDTIEHEAWNDSDELRVVLVFDIWNPFLTEVERVLIGRLVEALNEFLGGAPDSSA
jgi:aspartyl/asparaginyl beta-hydroxylase (cupin superfamily)